MGDILSEGSLKRLIEARDKAEFLAALMASAYKERLMKATLTELDDIERALKEELIDQYLMVIRSTSGELRDFFEEVFRRLEVENLKAVIRAKTSTLVPFKPLFFPLDSFFGRKVSNLMEAKSLESVIKQVENPYKDILEAVLPAYERSKKTLIFEIALDKELFSALWMRMKRLRAGDREIVRRVMGTEFDIENIMTVLRCTSEGVDEDEMRNYLFPYGYAFDLDSAEARASLSAADVSSAIRSLPSPYTDELLRALPLYERDGSLIPLEYALKGFFLRMVKDLLRRNPLNIGTVLGFLHLKKIEVKNLYAIAVCKENGIPVEKIKKLIIA
ncbi:MAG: hypothetical protein EFT35_09405 [Methanophagales archaeon ANME-1-THS]|nr:MAG: hypothetical protein EFT35_09405 [Methanophagales archaeon ANME-1-THS]